MKEETHVHKMFAIPQDGTQQSTKGEDSNSQESSPSVTRRRFLMYGGASTGALVAMAAASSGKHLEGGFERLMNSSSWKLSQTGPGFGSHPNVVSVAGAQWTRPYVYASVNVQRPFKIVTYVDFNYSPAPSYSPGEQLGTSITANVAIRESAWNYDTSSWNHSYYTWVVAATDSEAEGRFKIPDRFMDATTFVGLTNSPETNGGFTIATTIVQSSGAFNSSNAKWYYAKLTVTHPGIDGASNPQISMPPQSHFAISAPVTVTVIPA